MNATDIAALLGTEAGGPGKYCAPKWAYKVYTSGHGSERCRIQNQDRGRATARFRRCLQGRGSSGSAGDPGVYAQLRTEKASGNAAELVQ